MLWIESILNQTTKRHGARTMANSSSCYSLGIQAIVVGLLSATYYQLGLFDWPTFNEQSSIVMLEERRNKRDRPLHALVATCRHQDQFNHVERLLTATKQIARESNIEIIQHVVKMPANNDDDENENNSQEESVKTTTSNVVSLNMTDALINAARLYDSSPVVATTNSGVAVSLYYDNPSETLTPKWAVGWLVHVKKFHQLVDIAEQINTQKNEIFGSTENAQMILPEPIKAVRIGGHGPILKARIPWRTRLTLRLAPILHWNRGMKKYLKEYDDDDDDDGTQKTKAHSDNNCQNDGISSVVSCEMYVKSMEYGKSYIDYILLMGDTSNEWYDLFPPVEAINTNQRPVYEVSYINIQHLKPHLDL